MKNIYLVGFMGSGKSTVGKIVAEKLKMNFVDIDELIEKEKGMKITDIFKKKGEKYFRDLEKKKIKDLAVKENLVISTGGGLGADKENMDLMKKTGLVVWLDVSLDEILERCKGDKNRPLLNQSYENLKKLYEKRKPIYKMAHIHIKTGNKNPEEIAEEIMYVYLHRN